MKKTEGSLVKFVREHLKFIFPKDLKKKKKSLPPLS